MGFRFRKSINIIPGVRLNLSNGTPSLSVGPRGASVSFGSRGTFANLGLPGTGLSYRTRLDRAARSGGRNRSATDPGFRQSLEQEAAELMSAVTAIRNILNWRQTQKQASAGRSWRLYTCKTERRLFRSRHQFGLKSQNTFHCRKNLPGTKALVFWVNGLNRNQLKLSAMPRIFAGGSRG